MGATERFSQGLRSNSRWSLSFSRGWGGGELKQLQERVKVSDLARDQGFHGRGNKKKWGLRGGVEGWRMGEPDDSKL